MRRISFWRLEIFNTILIRVRTSRLILYDCVIFYGRFSNRQFIHIFNSKLTYMYSYIQYYAIYVFCNAESCVCALMTTLAVNLNEFLLFYINTCTLIIVYSHILEHIIVEALTIHLHIRLYG